MSNKTEEPIMPNSKNMLNDETLEKVTGGQLVDNWKEILDIIAKAIRDRKINYKTFKKSVLNGEYNDRITVVNDKGFSSYEADMIKKYLETIKW